MKKVTGLAKVDMEKCNGCKTCYSVCPVLAVTMENFRQKYDEHIEKKYCGADDCPNYFLSSCENACPVGVNVPGYTALIANGRFLDAYNLIMRENPFPSVCGRICTHPCEKACQRGQVDEPIAIRELKRFVADYAFNNEQPVSADMAFPKNGKSIGIIGSGPSGLACAYYLARLGYDVDVYERQSIAGGMLAFGIPEYRLPKNVLKREIDVIERQGVKIHLNTEVGVEISLKELRDKHDAIYVAIGTQLSKRANISGEDLPGVYHGLDFLRDVGFKKNLDVTGKKVCVIGGGNTAIDAARTALRLGAKQVTILYRREVEDMPADKLEVHDALEEGIEIIPLVAPLKVLGQDKVNGIECQVMELSDLDASGRRRPVPKKGETITLQADFIIPAISQSPDFSFISEAEADLTEGGMFKIDQDTQMTSLPGVFGGGDVVRGPNVAIEAIADGKQAARTIDKYLGGNGILNKGDKIDMPAAAEIDDIVEQPRFTIPLLDPDKRKNNFDEVLCGYDKLTAIAEAKRCLQCKKSTITIDRCLGCGNCEQRCPEHAISMTEREEPMIVGVDVTQFDQAKILDICVKAKFHPEQIICYCTATRAEEVAAAILQGAKTPEELSYLTGVRTGCSVECIQPLLRLLDAAGIKPQRPKGGWQWYGKTPTVWDIPDEVKEKYGRRGFYFDEDIKLLDRVVNAALQKKE